jgi:protein-tyrosine phosphatase
MNEIIPNLFLGDATFVYMEDIPDFKFIVNCCPEITCEYPKQFQNIEYLKFHDDRSENKRLISLVEEKKTLENIFNFLERNEKVLVHCAMGIQRSATIVVCFLVRYRNMSIKEAVKHVIKKRPQCFQTGFHFVEAMSYFSRPII